MIERPFTKFFHVIIGMILFLCGRELYHLISIDSELNVYFIFSVFGSAFFGIYTIALIISIVAESWDK